jgi:hypothetical protein
LGGPKFCLDIKIFQIDLCHILIKDGINQRLHTDTIPNNILDKNC